MHLLQHFHNLTKEPKNAKELKGLILQLAVQGKLTAQWRAENPDQEPATELLKRIAKEKAELVEAKKIRKEKPLPAISEEEKPYELPDGWSWCRLNYALKFIDYRGKTPKKISSGVRLLTAKNVRSGYLKTDPEEFMSENEYEKWMTRGFPQRGDLLFTTEAPLGKVCQLNLDEKVGLAQRIITMQPYLSELDKKFMMYCLMSNPIQLLILDKATGMTAKGIKASKLKLIPFPLPPLSEQKAIVEVVEKLFKEVESLEELTARRVVLRENFVKSALAELATDAPTAWAFLQPHFPTFFAHSKTIGQLREAVLQLAVQGKLTTQWRAENPDQEPANQLLKRIAKEKAQLIKNKKIKKEKPLPAISEEEKPYELPEGWVWCRMGSITDIQRGSSPRPKGDPIYFSEEKTSNHWISIKDISKYSYKHILTNTDEYLTDLGINYSRYVNVDELIVAVSGSTTGKCCLTGIEGYIYDGLAVVRLVGDKVNTKYHLMYYLQLYNHMNDSKFGAAFPNINTKFLNEMMFPLPPLSEQKAIVAQVDALMSFCDSLEQLVGKQALLSERLMQSAVREVLA
jgi:type I restriction enzyme S subunit